MATSFGGSLPAISLLLPVRVIADPYRGQRIPLVVTPDPVTVVVASTRKANHLPADHVAVAAINRVGEEALLRVLQQLLEEAALRISKIDRAILQPCNDLVLVGITKFDEPFAARGSCGNARRAPPMTCDSGPSDRPATAALAAWFHRGMGLSCTAPPQRRMARQAADR